MKQMPHLHPCMIIFCNCVVGTRDSGFGYFMLKIIKNAYYRIPNPEFPIPTTQLADKAMPHFYLINN
jgi:hypothetical protein